MCSYKVQKLMKEVFKYSKHLSKKKIRLLLNDLRILTLRQIVSFFIWTVQA